jgi:3-dehydroquinate dehydratase/shikimate dehydrogenase
MTLIAVSISVASADELAPALARVAVAAERGADLVEWRVDPLFDLAETGDAVPGAAALLLERSPLPSILTCRSVSEGGSFGGGPETLARLLVELAEAGGRARYVDVELEALRRFAPLRAAAQRVGESVILSAHDTKERPPDLLRRAAVMAREPAARIVKIAWRARSLRDNLEAFDLVAESRGPMIALCMGPFGLPSRVLAPKFGAFLTFASDRPGAETAPGQPTVEELRELYRFGAIGRGTAVYGVIGWPVAHSMSPRLHNAGFAAAAHDGVYLPLPVPPEYEHFKATVGAMLDHAQLGFRGASVTIPHKEHLMRFVRERGGDVDGVAQRIGAANTLVVAEDGRLEAINTDAPAALAALCAGMGIAPSALAGRRVAILGAGGAARAVAASLVEAGATVVVFGRTAERAGALVRDVSAPLLGRRSQTPLPPASRGRIAVGRPDAIACGCFEIIVNCTPVGMSGGGAEDRSPLPPEMPLGPDVTVFDTVYAPTRTPLLRTAAAAGARTIGGAGMLLRQAALQFEAWTARPAPEAYTDASIVG